MQGTQGFQSTAWNAVDQVAYLRDRKGVKFDLMHESEAAIFLSDRNYFFKVKAFGKNYEKYFEEGDRKGRYVNLDFAYLVELTRLDKHLRSLVLDLTLDIEHYLKVRINAAAMKQGVDSCLLSERFLERSSLNVLSEQTRRIDVEEARCIFERVSAMLAAPLEDAEDAALRGNAALHELESVTQGRNPDYIAESFVSMNGSPYSKDLVNKYSSGLVPYWCLMELMSFGSVIKFYRTCFSKGGILDEAGEREKLKRIRNLLRCSHVLRNAAAHNDCLLNGLSYRERTGARTDIRKRLAHDYGIDEADLADVGTIGIAMDLAAVLMCYDEVVPNGQTRDAAAKKLGSAAVRLAKHEEWFSKNYHVKSYLGFMGLLLPEFAKRFERERKDCCS